MCLYLRAGAERLAIPASAVIEVIPSVSLHHPAGLPDWVAGVLRYRGTVTPDIDLPRLAAGISCEPKLSTRIVLVDYPVGGTMRPLGLLAESVTELGELGTIGPEFAPTGAGPDLGPMVANAEGVVRLTRLDRLVPPGYRGVLFATEGGP